MTAVEVEPWAGVRGVQVPRLRVAPEWTVPPPLGVETVEMAAAYGLVLDEWQALGVYDACVERPDGRYEAVEVDEVVARQNGKNGKIRALQLHKLFVLRRRQMHTAHEFKTAREHFDKMLALVENYDELRREVARVSTSHGEEGITLRRLDGEDEPPALRFVARSRGSGRGFDPDDLYYDESLILNDETYAASLPSQSASPNAQRFLFSSAGTRASAVLGRHRRRGLAVLAGKRPRGRFAFAEYSPPPGSGPGGALTDEERGDPRTWAWSNPGMPHRITGETIAGEHDSMAPEQFDRERLSIGDWPPEEGGLQWDVIAERAWILRQGAAPRPEPARAFTLAIGGSWPDAEWCTIAASWADDGEQVVEVVDRREGAGWVLDRCAGIAESLAGAGKGKLLGVGVAKGGTAYAALGPELARSRLPVVLLGLGEECEAASGFKGDVDGDDPRLRHYAQTVLDESVGGAGKHHVGDRWRWDRNGMSDPVEAAGLARLLHVTRSARRLPAIF